MHFFRKHLLTYCKLIYEMWHSLKQLKLIEII